VAIGDIDTPDSDGWWLKQLYTQLLEQRRYCQKMLDRYMGDPPLPYLTENQKDSVKWFVGASRTNFERLIVDSVLSRLRIRGIRTAQGPDDGGDPEAFAAWKQSKGKLWNHDVTREEDVARAVQFLNDTDRVLTRHVLDIRFAYVVFDEHRQVYHADVGCRNAHRVTVQLSFQRRNDQMHAQRAARRDREASEPRLGRIRRTRVQGRKTQGQRHDIGIIGFRAPIVDDAPAIGSTAGAAAGPSRSPGMPQPGRFARG